MIIGFWSEEAGIGSATYNMIATGLSLSTKCNEKVVLMQGKKDYNRIDYAFTPYDNNGILKEDYGYYNYGGIDSIINKLENGMISLNEFTKELVQIRKTNLYYLPSSRSQYNDTFNLRFINIYKKFSYFLKSVKDIILIELSSGYENISNNILEQLDILVVNIPQNNIAIKDLIKQKEIMEKVVFIIGSYDADSENNINNIRRKYGIDEKNIYAIPYNIRFKDAICSGRSQEYYERHLESKKNDSEYEFMKHLDSISEMIIKRCGIG